MHILIFNWRDIKNPKSGGAEIVTFHHAKAWVKAGNKVTWFSSYFPEGKREEKVEGIDIIRKGNSLTVYLLAPFFYLFSKETFDIVIDEIHGIPFFTPLYVRKPKIAFIHEVAGEIWDYMYSFPINLIGKFSELLYFKFYKNITFWTDAQITVKDLGKKGILKKKCVVLPCPITNPTVKVIPKKGEHPIFVYVGRLVKMKGIEDVLQSFHLIHKKNPNAILWIIGTGEKEYVSYLKSMIHTLKISKSVEFWGFVSEQKKIYLLHKAHILLHASVKEGWGLVVLEAASQGTPSIVYNLGSLPEVVVHNKTGIVVKKNTPEYLAEASIQLLNNKNRYAQFQKQGIMWVKSFQWGEITDKSLDLLKKTSGHNN